MRILGSLFILLLATGVLSAQSGINYLDATVIVKLKPEFRSIGSGDTLKHEELAPIFSSLKVNDVVQKFPRAEIIEAARTVAPGQAPDRRVDISLIYEIHYTAALHPLKAAKMLSALSFFEYAEAMIVPKLCIIPNDQLLDTMYHLQAINAFEAWDVDTGSSDIVIAIVDTGVDWDHPDMWGSIQVNEDETPNNGIDDDENGYIDDYLGWDFNDNDNDPNEQRFSHGTHVAGLSGAVVNNNYGIAGTGWACKIMAIRAGDINLPYGYDGIIYAADNGADIINCSWGSFGYSNYAHDVVKYATYNKGAVLLGGAGNDNRENRFYPASYPEMISVGSSNIEELKADFSNYNYDIDLIAPGKSIFSLKNDTFGYDSGTSMSAPIVAGVAGLVKHHFPNYTALQIREQLRVTCDATIYELPGNAAYQGKLGTGQLNMLAALTNDSMPALRIDNFELTDGDDNVLKPGESFTLGVEIGNYLSALDGITLTLEALSGNVGVLNGTWEIGSLGTLTFKNNFTAPFELEVIAADEYDAEVDLKLTATSTQSDYVYTKYLTITINASFVNVVVNDVKTTISKHGLIGYTSFLQDEGLGFVIDTHGNVLYEAGLMIGKKTDYGARVVDRVRSPRVADQDFWQESVIERMVPEADEAFLARGSFVDTSAIDDGLGLRISQEVRAYDEEGHRNYVVVEYDIENVSGEDLYGLSAGIFADWDIHYPLENKGVTSLPRRLGYIYYTGQESLSAGIQALSNQPFHSYMIDNVEGGGGGVQLYDEDGFTSVDKFTTLSTDRLEGGLQGEGDKGNDVIQVVSVDGIDIAKGASVKVAFALHGARSTEQLIESVDSAYYRYYGFSPGVLTPTIFHVTQVWPNPMVDETSTRVSLQVKQQIQVNFELFSADGLRLHEHQSGELYPGYNEVELQFPDLESGIYFLKVYVDDYDEVVRIARVVR